MFVTINERDVITGFYDGCEPPEGAIEAIGTGELVTRGVYASKLVDGAITPRTDAEINADIALLPAPLPTPQAQTDVLVIDHEERLIYLELGL